MLTPGKIPSKFYATPNPKSFEAYRLINAGNIYNASRSHPFLQGTLSFSRTMKRVDKLPAQETKPESYISSKTQMKLTPT